MLTLLFRPGFGGGLDRTQSPDPPPDSINPNLIYDPPGLLGSQQPSTVEPAAQGSVGNAFVFFLVAFSPR